MSSDGQTTQTTQAPAGTLAADPGYAALDPVIRGAFENKGWNTKSPFEAAVEAAKSHSELERHLGIPKDQIVRLPKDASDADGWKAFNAKMGVPAKAEEYDLSKIKRADGSDLNSGFVNAVKAAMHAEGVPASRAPSLVNGVVKWMDGEDASQRAALQAALVEGQQKLSASWGQNFEANKFVAGQAVSRLGLTKDFIETVEKTAGYEPTMQMLLKLGQMMGEDKVISNDRGDGRSILTREQAMARKAELRRDDEWVRKVNAGDVVANEELMALDRIISGMMRAA